MAETAKTEQEPIRLVLVSGFLGAGKTTFMKSLIASLAPARLGVLVNEFGSIGIDGPLVNQSGLKLVEINDGSVFCACLKDGFVRTLKAFAEQPIDMLLIESSGMADPAAMNTILEGLAPYLARPYHYMGCVCLVDCTTFPEYVEVLMPVQNQVATADLIVVNKTDLVGEETLIEVERLVRVLNEQAPIHRTIYAHVPAELLEQKLQSHGYAGVSSNTPSNRPSTYILTADAPVEKGALEAFYAEIAPQMLRVKGFLHSGTGWWHVEGVARQFEVRPAELDVEDARLLGAGGRLVLIAAGKTDVSGAILAAWEKHCMVPANLRAT